MTKVALISDTHFGVKNDSPAFYSYYKKSFEWFFDYIDRNQIKYVIHPGDLYHRRKYINYVTANLCRTLFLDELAKRNIETHIICGNHDVYYKDTNRINSLFEVVESRYNNIHTYQDPDTISIDGVGIDLLPWIPSSASESKAFIDFVNRSEKDKPTILISHLELLGFELVKGIKSEHGMDSKLFGGYPMVISGHYHHRSNNDNIYYIGAFTEQSWSDLDVPMGFTVLNLKTRDLDFQRNPHSIYKVIEYDDTDDEEIYDKVKSVDFSHYRDCYIRVICKSTPTNLYAFDTLMNGLYKVNPVDVSSIEDPKVLADIKDSVEDLAPINSDSTESIISDYISSITLPVDTKKMKDLMIQIYRDASHING